MKTVSFLGVLLYVLLWINIRPPNQRINRCTGEIWGPNLLLSEKAFGPSHHLLRLVLKKQTNTRFFKVTSFGPIAVTFSGLKWPPFRESNGHFKEAGMHVDSMTQEGIWLFYDTMISGQIAYISKTWITTAFWGRIPLLNHYLDLFGVTNCRFRRYNLPKEHHPPILCFYNILFPWKSNHHSLQVGGNEFHIFL